MEDVVSILEREHTLHRFCPLNIMIANKNKFFEPLREQAQSEPSLANRKILAPKRSISAMRRQQAGIRWQYEQQARSRSDYFTAATLAFHLQLSMAKSSTTPAQQ